MKIVWTSGAIADLVQIHSFISDQNPTAAQKTADAIMAAVAGLESFPAMGRPGRLPDTRELVLAGTPFFVSYRVRELTLEIIAVIHGARRWPLEPNHSIDASNDE